MGRGTVLGSGANGVLLIRLLRKRCFNMAASNRLHHQSRVAWWLRILGPSAIIRIVGQELFSALLVSASYCLLLGWSFSRTDDLQPLEILAYSRYVMIGQGSLTESPSQPLVSPIAQQGWRGIRKSPCFFQV
jgi:hypothetical protein